MSPKLSESLAKQKEYLPEQIMRTGQPLEARMKLLIGIRGITALLALADVGDIHRFGSLRRLQACLGVVPRVHPGGETAAWGT
jgi:transposase